MKILTVIIDSVMNEAQTFVYTGHDSLDHFYGSEEDEDELSGKEAMITHVIVHKYVQEVSNMNMFENLRRIDLHPNIDTIGHGAFDGCRFLEDVDLPISLETIENYAFEGTGLRTIVIPLNVKKIPKGCFANCLQLEFAELPEGIEYIDMKAFQNCHKLRRIKIPSTIKISELEDDQTHEASWFLNCTKLELVCLPSTLTGIPGWCFRGCSNLEYIQLQDGLKELGRGAFMNSGLTRITIPSSVEDLGGGNWSSSSGEAFENCRHLQSVDLPEGSLRCIPYKTFKGCSSLASITLPESVDRIFGSAFADCTSLTSITIQAKKIRHIAADSFHGCVNVRTIKASPAVLPLLLQNMDHRSTHNNDNMCTVHFS